MIVNESVLKQSEQRLHLATEPADLFVWELNLGNGSVVHISLRKYAEAIRTYICLASGMGYR